MKRKMVRLKQTCPKAATVRLLITGTKSLLQGSVHIDAVTSDTWVYVLQEQLGLQVEPGDGVFVCTARYCPTNPKDGDGWRAEISESINQFISKFERNRRQYSVKLVNPVDVGVSPRRDSQSVETTSPTKAGGSSPQKPKAAQIAGGRQKRPFSAMQRPGPSTQKRPCSAMQRPGPSTQKRPFSAMQRPGPSTQKRPCSAMQRPGPSKQKRPVSALQRPGPSTQKRPCPEMQRPGPSKQKRVEVGIKVEPENSLEEDDVNGGDNEDEEEDYYWGLLAAENQEEAEVGNEGISMENVKVAGGDDDDEDDYYFGLLAAENQEEAELGNEGISMENVKMNEADDEEDDNNFGYLAAAENQEESELGDVGISMENVKMNEADDDDEEDDNNFGNLAAAENQEEAEHRNVGISMETVNAVVARFSNAFMLRMQNEIHRLQRSNKWDRLMIRSPLCCYLLQDLFKDPDAP